MHSDTENYIAGLKAGDVVYVETSIHSTKGGYEGTVGKVTPSGQISVIRNSFEYNRRFDKHGREIGGGKRHPARIVSKKRYDEICAYAYDRKTREDIRKLLDAKSHLPPEEIIAACDAAKALAETLKVAENATL